MKKYVTTDKHPELKEGIELLGYIRLTEAELKHDLSQGYIKELEEPEFTKSDLYNLAQFIAKPLIIAGKITDTYAGAKTTDWLKKRK